MRQVRPRNHHAAEQGELGQRRPQHRKGLAQATRVERHWLQYTSAQRGARQVRIVVRVNLHRLQANRRVCFQPGHRRRGVGQEGLAHRRVVITGDQRREVLPRCRHAVRAADRSGHGIAGHPHHAARNRCGAADQQRLFEQYDLQPRRRCDRGGCHPAGAGAKDDNIALLVPA